MKKFEKELQLYNTIQIPRTEASEQADYAISVKDDCLNPVFFNGDLLLVKYQESVSNGEIGLFRIDERICVKKYSDGKLISFNKDIADIDISQKTDIKCVGKLIGRA